MKHCNIFPDKKQYCPWHCCQQRSYLIRQGQQYGYYYNSEIVVVLIGVISSCHVAIGKENYLVQQFATSSLICERVIKGKKAVDGTDFDSTEHVRNRLGSINGPIGRDAARDTIQAAVYSQWCPMCLSCSYSNSVSYYSFCIKSVTK